MCSHYNLSARPPRAFSSRHTIITNASMTRPTRVTNTTLLTNASHSRLQGSSLFLCSCIAVNWVFLRPGTGLHRIGVNIAKMCRATKRLINYNCYRPAVTLRPSANQQDHLVNHAAFNQSANFSILDPAKTRILVPTSLLIKIQ